MITLPTSARWPRSGSEQRRERGTSAVEYSLLVTAITVVIAAIVFSVGVKVKTRLDDTCRNLAGASAEQHAAKPPAGARAPAATDCAGR